MTTEAQAKYIMTLIEERKQAVMADEVLRSTDLDSLGPKQASQLIDKLKRMPKDPDPAMPPCVVESVRHGKNRYENLCSSCGHKVPAGNGYYYTFNNQTLTHHKVGECSTEPVTKPVQTTYEAGLYVTDDDIVLLYHYGKSLYGKVWRDNKFQVLYYARSFLRQNNGRKMTPDEVDTFSIVAGGVGKHIKTCVFCSRPLSDEGDGRSMEKGYGPICASRYGLPWG